MADAGFLACFVMFLVQAFSKSAMSSELVLAFSMIGMGLCAIADGLKYKK